MAFQPCPGITEVAAIYSSNDIPCENVYHVSGADDLAALCDAVAAWEADTASSLRADNVSLEKVTARDLSTEGGPFVEQDHHVVGGGAHEVLPNNATIAITHRTGLSGRSNRGRSYWIGLMEAQLAGGGNYISASVGTSLVAAMTNLKTVFTEAGGTMVVLSRYHNGAPRGSGIGTAITSFGLADTNIDSQRRRLPGHNRRR